MSDDDANAPVHTWVNWVPHATGLEVHQWAYIIAGVFTVLSCIVSFHTIFKHLANYQHPFIQKAMIRVVFMIPLYVIASFLSLVFQEQGFYFTLVRDCYESYVLFMFLKLLIALADGDEALIHKLEYLKQIRCFMPLCCMHIKPGRIFLHRCKQMVLQFVIIKPILAFLIFILTLAGYYEEGDFNPRGGYLYLTLLYNISFTLALYFLVLFYESSKEILARFRPLSKFMCIKAVVFFSWYQSIAIAIMVHFGWVIAAEDDWTVSMIATALQNTLICVEMFPLAVAHVGSFGYKSYRDDNIIELNEIDSNTTMLQKILDAANFADVFKDTWQAMKLGPKRNVTATAVGGFIGMTSDEQKNCIILEGWVYKRGEDLAKIWKKRWCYLINKPRGMVYFKKNPATNPEVALKPRGFVDFSDLVGVSPHRSNFERFTVVTNARKWHFRGRTKKERDEWMLAIESLHGGVPLANLHSDTLMDVPLDDREDEGVLKPDISTQESASDFDDHPVSTTLHHIVDMDFDLADSGKADTL